jgi:hypothetical protein
MQCSHGHVGQMGQMVQLGYAEQPWTCGAVGQMGQTVQLGHAEQPWTCGAVGQMGHLVQLEHTVQPWDMWCSAMVQWATRACSAAMDMWCSAMVQWGHLVHAVQPWTLAWCSGHLVARRMKHVGQEDGEDGAAIHAVQPCGVVGQTGHLVHAARACSTVQRSRPWTHGAVRQMHLAAASDSVHVHAQ